MLDFVHHTFEVYTIAKKTDNGMAEMQDTNSKIIYKLVAMDPVQQTENC
jgi:hypothetical protein